MAEESKDDASQPSLVQWLQSGPFALTLAPCFFGFYAHCGALQALDKEGALDEVSFVCGASAGALVGGIYAAGVSPNDMAERVVKFKRSDFWDPLGLGGLLRGAKFHRLIEDFLPPDVKSFKDTKIPLGVTCFDLMSLSTKHVTSGSLSAGIGGSCTFPGLFQPVWSSEYGLLVDGGVEDWSGMSCVPDHSSDCKRILNITFAGENFAHSETARPSTFPNARGRRLHATRKEIVSLVLPRHKLPSPHPFAMELGEQAIKVSHDLVRSVMHEPLVRGAEAGHWVASPPLVSKGGAAGDDVAATAGAKRMSTKVGARPSKTKKRRKR